MARNTYGLDLGSYEIKVYDKKQDTIWKEKDVIAIRDKKEIFAVGDEAYEMYEAVAKQNNQVPMEFDQFVKSVTLAEIDNPVLGTPAQEEEDLPEIPSGEVDLSAPTPANKDIGSNVMAEALGKALEPDQDGSMVIPVRRKH